jgi:hypothetical protein
MSFTKSSLPRGTALLAIETEQRKEKKTEKNKPNKKVDKKGKEAVDEKQRGRGFVWFVFFLFLLFVRNVSLTFEANPSPTHSQANLRVCAKRSFVCYGVG